MDSSNSSFEHIALSPLKASPRASPVRSEPTNSAEVLDEWLIGAAHSDPVELVGQHFTGSEDDARRLCLLQKVLEKQVQSFDTCPKYELEGSNSKTLLSLAWKRFEEALKKCRNLNHFAEHYLQRAILKAQESRSETDMTISHEKKKRMDDLINECRHHILKHWPVCKRLITDWEIYAKGILAEQQPGESVPPDRMIEMEAACGSLSRFIYDLTESHYPRIGKGDERDNHNRPDVLRDDWVLVDSDVDDARGLDAGCVIFDDHRPFDLDHHWDSHFSRENQRQAGTGAGPMNQAGTGRCIVVGVQSPCDHFDIDTIQLDELLAATTLQNVGLVKMLKVRYRSSTAVEHIQFGDQAVASEKGASNSPALKKKMEVLQFVVAVTSTNILVRNLKAGGTTKSCLQLGPNEEFKCMASYDNMLYAVLVDNGHPYLRIYACRLLRNSSLGIFHRKTVRLILNVQDTEFAAVKTPDYSCAVTRDNFYLYVDRMTSRKAYLFKYTRLGKSIERLENTQDLGKKPKEERNLFQGEDYLCGIIKRCECLLFSSTDYLVEDSKGPEYHTYDLRRKQVQPFN